MKPNARPVQGTTAKSSLPSSWLMAPKIAGNRWDFEPLGSTRPGLSLEDFPSNNNPTRSYPSSNGLGLGWGAGRLEGVLGLGSCSAEEVGVGLKTAKFTRKKRRPSQPKPNCLFSFLLLFLSGMSPPWDLFLGLIMCTRVLLPWWLCGPGNGKGLGPVMASKSTCQIFDRIRICFMRLKTSTTKIHHPPNIP